jgi:ATP phosphoribosyltransferase
MHDSLAIAVPKGRVLEQLVPRLERAGLDSTPLTKRSRKLIREDRERGLRYFLLKPDDVPTYVEFGTADLGIVGRDVLDERSYDLYAPLDLEIGRCRMVVAGPPGASLGRGLSRPLRIGTKFPQIAQRHFREQGVPVEIIFLQGSVELAPITGLSDVIVDIVETGETLKQNGLAELETISTVSSMVVVNRASLKIKRDRIVPLLRALRAEG